MEVEEGVVTKEEEKVNKSGRPRKFNNAEEMQKKIDAYFKSCFIPARDKEGNFIKNENGEVYLQQYKPFTMTGLANALDMSRVSLMNYSKEEEFFNTITRARRIVEQYTEERLFDKDGNKGAIFSLSNNFKGWKEKQELNANVNTEIKVTLTDD